jgi:hypothetical protein
VRDAALVAGDPGGVERRRAPRCDDGHRAGVK